MEDAKNVITRLTQQNTNPYASSNIISKIFFCWPWPLFYKGLQTDLTEEDIYPPLKSHEASKLGDRLQQAWSDELFKKNSSLLRAISKVFGGDFAAVGLLYLFIELGTKLVQPIFLSKLLTYYEPDPKITLKEAYLYSGLIVLACLATVICSQSYAFLVYHLGMQLRVATSSLIYRKALKLSKSALAETTIGQMVNMLSNDVTRFELATSHLHNLWIAPLETIVIMVLLYFYVGYTGMLGIVFLLLFIPLQLFVGKKTSQYRFKSAVRTDDRIRLMNEVLAGIQVIKMYIWEKPFITLVELSRRKEIREIQKLAILRAITMSMNIFSGRAAIFLCILTYVLTGNVPTANYVFVLTSFYANIRLPLTTFFGIAVNQLAETRISIKRIREFLMRDELIRKNELRTPKINNKASGEIFLKNVTAKWLKSSNSNTLEYVNFSARPEDLVAIVGPVGSGKTTLLHIILRELSPISGEVNISGTISYASQEAWLFGGSVRQNILFGQEFDETRYEEVVKVCALERDFKLFPYGDRTLVGDRGVALSGGQKARINLARAIYKPADIYLLDDPLSAVDSHVGKHLFEVCIEKYLRKKCVVLVTHQLQYLKSVKHIYLLANGRVEESGDYFQLVRSGKEFTKLLLATEENENTNNEVSSIKTSISIDKSKENPNKEDEEDPTIAKEGKEIGNIGWKVYKAYITAAGHWFKILMLFMAFVLAQLFGSLCDYFLSFWVNMEQTLNNTLADDGPKNVTKTTFSDFVYEKNNLIILYTFLVFLVLIVTLIRSVMFYKYCLKASVRLHNSMFEKIIFAPMRFFFVNPLGRILNRFSKDLGNVDEMLPFTLIETIQVGLAVFAISFVIGSVSPWMVLTSVIMLLIFYGIRTIFLATSRDIKRLEAITRSPIYSHLTASIQGLTTIRAFGAEDILKHEFDNYQNLYSGAYFMFMGANRSFGFWLDVLCVGYIGLVTVSFLYIQNESLGGNVGLAITQAMGLIGMFQWGMIQWSELENQMTCVERIKEFADMPTESQDEKIETQTQWPQKGEIIFNNLSLRYAPEDPYVLKSLNFKINSTEKVGIVGRTGAGKSSLIAALFRLTAIDGEIIIDDVNISTLSLNKLRSKISIIPQEPVLFSGTLRKNLDRFDKYDDDVLWNALDDVELKQAISELPHGLESRISEGGSNFSVGQRQLLCLARAIIRNNNILVLDEATANVDPHTDALIQSTIRVKFAGCTVLTIAHRLHTIMDSDKVLVMDAGELKEFGHPYQLLKNSDGVFSELVANTGTVMAQNLYEIAKESYNKYSAKLKDV